MTPQQQREHCQYSRTLEEVGDFCIIKDDWISELQCNQCPARPHTSAPLIDTNYNCRFCSGRSSCESFGHVKHCNDFELDVAKLNRVQKDHDAATALTAALAAYEEAASWGKKFGRDAIPGFVDARITGLRLIPHGGNHYDTICTAERKAP